MPTTTTVNQSKIEYDETKFAELILYVASRMAGDPSYGSVKFNKVLFFSDFLHYAVYGTPISGVEYVRHPLGPAPRGIKTLQERLISSGDADLAILRKGGRAQKILFPKRDIDIDMFRSSEIAVVNEVIDALKDNTMDEVSNLSHRYLAWKSAHERATIPYDAIFLYDGPYTDSDILHAESVAKTLRTELKSAGIPVDTAA
jgi:hypothetical protein